jgi:hypothetical protein
MLLLLAALPILRTAVTCSTGQTRHAVQVMPDVCSQVDEVYIAEDVFATSSASSVEMCSR